MTNEHQDPNSSHMSEEFIPIVGTSDNFHFILEFTHEDQPCNVVLFAHQDTNLPLYTVYYDYFFTGNIYFNIPKGVQITSVKKEFLDKYKLICFNPDFQKLALENPDSFNTKYSWVSVTNMNIPSIKTSYSENVSALFLGFSVFANVKNEQVFQLEENSTQIISSSQVPQCQYYTYVSSSEICNDTISNHYSFANHLEDISMCSHSIHNGSFAPCSYSSHDVSSSLSQTNCPVYSPCVSLVEISNLKINNIESIDSILQFHLKYFSSNENHTFYVKDSLKNTNLIFFTYPISQHSYEDSLSLARTAFRDFLSLIFPENDPAYSDPVEEQTSVSEQTTYISHLLSI